MTLSAALDSGLAVGVVVIFFGIVDPGWMSGCKWWGTEVYKQVSHVCNAFLHAIGMLTPMIGLRLDSVLVQNCT